jgi:multiple sugar transport system permease protein
MATTTQTSTVASTTRASEVTVIRNNRRIFQLAITYVILIAVALLIILPLLWMLSTSLKPKSQWFTREIQWIPQTFTFENYQKIFSNSTLPIGRWFINSVGVAVASTVLTLVVDALAAYAYGRMHFKGRNAIFGLMLATLFLPGIMFLIPNFLTTVRILGFRDNYLGLIIPGLAGVFGVFFLRQFFEGIPKELEEAAEIDGATTFQTFYLVALPLAKPALATLGVITFLASWNDFLWPLLIMQNRELLTLPPGLRQLQGAFTSEYGLMMAGAVIVAIPVLLIYVALQRFIVASVATTGLKG